jgi:hypothetical protein
MFGRESAMLISFHHVWPMSAGSLAANPETGMVCAEPLGQLAADHGLVHRVLAGLVAH